MHYYRTNNQGVFITHRTIDIQHHTHKERTILPNDTQFTLTMTQLIPDRCRAIVEFQNAKQQTERVNVDISTETIYEWLLNQIDLRDFEIGKPFPFPFIVDHNEFMPVIEGKTIVRQLKKRQPIKQPHLRNYTLESFQWYKDDKGNTHLYICDLYTDKEDRFKKMVMIPHIDTYETPPTQDTILSWFENKTIDEHVSYLNTKQHTFVEHVREHEPNTLTKKELNNWLFKLNQTLIDEHIEHHVRLHEHSPLLNERYQDLVKRIQQHDENNHLIYKQIGRFEKKCVNKTLTQGDITHPFHLYYLYVHEQIIYTNDLYAITAHKNPDWLHIQYKPNFVRNAKSLLSQLLQENEHTKNQM